MYATRSRGNTGLTIHRRGALTRVESVRRSPIGRTTEGTWGRATRWEWWTVLPWRSTGRPASVSVRGEGRHSWAYEVSIYRLHCTKSDYTHLGVGTRPVPCLGDPCQEVGPCSEGKGAHLEAPSCQVGAYLPGREALADDLQVVRNEERVEKVKQTYHRMEVDRQTREEARRSPWEDHRTADREELDAEDQTQTHQEVEDYRSRMQL